MSTSLELKIRQILNKLKADTCKIVAQEFAKLPFNEDNARINGAAEVLMEKIENKPSLAKFCAEMLHIFGSTRSDSSRRLLVQILNRCQIQFHKNVRELESVKSSDTVIGTSELKLRKSSNSIIHFIAELYNVYLINSKIIVNCIERLLETRDEGNLEGLYLLLKNVGFKLECEIEDHTDKLDSKWRPSEDSISQIFENVLQISQNMDLTEATRTGLLSVLELRRNKWGMNVANDKSEVDDRNEDELIVCPEMSGVKHTVFDSCPEPSNRKNLKDNIPSCDNATGLQYYSMYANYDRMLKQLSPDVVEDLNMEMTIMIYRTLKHQQNPQKSAFVHHS